MECVFLIFGMTEVKASTALVCTTEQLSTHPMHCVVRLLIPLYTLAFQTYLLLGKVNFMLDLSLFGHSPQNL